MLKKCALLIAVFAAVALPSTEALSWRADGTHGAYDGAPRHGRHYRGSVVRVTHAPPSFFVLAYPVYAADTCYQFNDRDWEGEWVSC